MKKGQSALTKIILAMAEGSNESLSEIASCSTNSVLVSALQIAKLNKNHDAQLIIASNMQQKDAKELFKQLVGLCRDEQIDSAKLLLKAVSPFSASDANAVLNFAYMRSADFCDKTATNLIAYNTALRLFGSYLNIHVHSDTPRIASELLNKSLSVAFRITHAYPYYLNVVREGDFDIVDFRALTLGALLSPFESDLESFCALVAGDLFQDIKYKSEVFKCLLEYCQCNREVRPLKFKKIVSIIFTSKDVVQKLLNELSEMELMEVFFYLGEWLKPHLHHIEVNELSIPPSLVAESPDITTLMQFCICHCLLFKADTRIDAPYTYGRTDKYKVDTAVSTLCNTLRQQKGITSLKLISDKLHILKTNSQNRAGAPEESIGAVMTESDIAKLWASMDWDLTGASAELNTPVKALLRKAIKHIGSSPIFNQSILHKAGIYSVLEIGINEAEFDLLESFMDFSDLNFAFVKNPKSAMTLLVKSASKGE